MKFHVRIYFIPAIVSNFASSILVSFLNPPVGKGQ